MLAVLSRSWERLTPSGDLKFPFSRRKTDMRWSLSAVEINMCPKVQIIKSAQCALGFVTSYLLYGIALVSVMGVAASKLYYEKEQARVIQENVDELAAQVDLIRGKVLLCSAIYPAGPGHGEFGARPEYPAPPAASAHQAEIGLVTCPNSPGGVLTLNQLSDGLPLPRTLPEFDPWVYEHTEIDGIRLILRPKTPGAAEPVRTRLVRKLGNIAFASGDDVIVSVLN